MMSEYVYRVQDADGRGPWKPGVSELWVEDKPIEEYARLKSVLTEFHDLLSRLRPGFHIGVACDSLESLRNWISRSEWKKLKKLGYRCHRIRPDRIVCRSDIQLVFESKKPLSSHLKTLQLY